MVNKYSKTKLEKFKKDILKKMGAVSEGIETIKEGIGNASNKQGGVTPDSIFSVHIIKYKIKMLLRNGKKYFKVENQPFKMVLLPKKIKE